MGPVQADDMSRANHIGRWPQSAFIALNATSQQKASPPALVFLALREQRLGHSGATVRASLGLVAA
jgi:hypothetical protein